MKFDEIDILDNVPNHKIQCLDKGFVSIVDVMPRIVKANPGTADGAIVQMARVSYGEGTKTVNEDRGLIRYLMRHAHTTPFEGVKFKFLMKMPIFVARQLVRHRAANINEISGRYSVMKDEFYIPALEDLKVQNKNNKQGGGHHLNPATAQDFLDYLDTLCKGSYGAYKEFLDHDMNREQARMILPLNLYTEWFFAMDLHNLFHFLGLRCDAHAQYETRVFAEAILTLIEPIVPWAVEAWNDYHPMRGALKLTRLEVEALAKHLGHLHSFDIHVPPLEIASDNKREQEEWQEKLKRFGISKQSQSEIDVVADKKRVEDEWQEKLKSFGIPAPKEAAVPETSAEPKHPVEILDDLHVFYANDFHQDESTNIDPGGKTRVTYSSLEHKPALSGTVTGVVYHGKIAIQTFIAGIDGLLSASGDKPNITDIHPKNLPDVRVMSGKFNHQTSELTLNWMGTPGRNHCLVSYETARLPK